MKKKLVLKPFVIPILYTIFAALVITGLLSTIPTIDDEKTPVYVSRSILDEYIPVINTYEEVLIRPYSNNDVAVSKNYYGFGKNHDAQVNSIIVHDGTYIQNTGINYESDNEFEVVSVLNGEVIDVDVKELLGNTITIRHDNNIISVYQSLKETYVKKGDIVNIGQVIGISGNCEMINTKENNLHFELYVNGVVVDPDEYYDKEVNKF